MDGIFTTCEHCAHRFEALSTLAGGLMNCPSCGRATAVPGGVDTLWNVAVGAAIAGTVVVVVAAYLSGGPVLAGVVLACCALAGLIARLSS